MRRKTSKYLLALCLLASCYVVGSGQTKGIAVKGVVLDPNEARVPRARISVVGKILKRESESDEIGNFSVELPPDTYLIVVESPGFRTFKLSNLRVREGMSEIKVVLKVKEVKYGKCPKGQICLWL